jgi:hypothetical protein
MRSRSVVLATLALVTVLWSACGREQAKPKEVSTPPGQAGGEPIHADAHVVPGSYEDWCGEHAVPESMCTRCNPTLAAAFKATNDWCGEHGLPESQCLACNPGLKIVRPPKPGAK